MNRSRTFLLLLFLTFGSLFVHGYHPFAEDAEIYLPGVERILQPELFSTDARLFDSYAHFSLFARLIAESVRFTHLSLEAVLFLWHLLSVFLLLLGCRKLSEQCFASEVARWAGVGVIAALLTLPVAGTALYIMDQYVNPRNLAAFAGIFAVTASLEGKHLRAGSWVGFALLLHPLMGVFILFLCGLLVLRAKLQPGLLLAGSFFPALFDPPSSPAYLEAARLHSSHYLLTWRWYEWLGIIAPLAILWWVEVQADDHREPQIRRLSQTLVIYGLVCFAGALLCSLQGDYGPLARFQPLRGFHLLYLILFLLIGGYLGKFVLKNHAWRWIVLFAPLCLGMFIAQRTLFPASAHIEWPGTESWNPWAKAFVWAREHTEKQAKFALDPTYIRIAGEDIQGFRATAQRSKLADSGKDSGEVSMFPELADAWWKEVEAQRNWRNFTQSDFQRLKQDYGVTWVILKDRSNLSLPCPYRNEAVMVCQVN
jgi:hypothetical protein